MNTKEPEVPAVKKRRMGLFSKVVVAIFAVYCAMMLLVLQVQINEKRAMTEQLQQRVEAKRLSNSALSEAIDSELDSEAITRLAREKFGYVKPGEIVFFDVSP